MTEKIPLEDDKALAPYWERELSEEQRRILATKDKARSLTNRDSP